MEIEKFKMLLFLFSRIIIFSFTYLILIISIPDTSVSFNDYKDQINLRKNIPEGWAFFTRNPRETDIEYFIINDGKLYKNEVFPFSSASNFFGVSRKPKVINAEMYMVLNQIDSTKLCKTDGCTIDQIARKERKFVTIKNPSKSQLLHDSICVLFYEPIPWAWSGIMNQDVNKGQYVFINITR